MEQPFIVGKPVSGKYFIDRVKELKKLLALLAGASKGNINNVILLGLRRTGKSSILLNAQKHLIRKNKSIVIIFDAYGISTKERFARKFVDAVLSSYVEQTGDPAYKQKLKKLLGQGYDALKNKVSEFGIEVSEFVKFQTKLRESSINEDELLEQALKYAEKLGNEKGISFIIMIDEFQELLKWGDEFLKMFRRLVQSQSHISYVLSGSAPTIMKNMVYDSRSPFYKQLIEIPIGMLDKQSVTSFVKKRLQSVKISIDPVALDKVYHLSRGFPDYVQRLGLSLYLLCLDEDKKELKENDIDRAYSEMIDQLDADFSSQFATHSDLEREILIALANSIDTPTAIALEIRKLRTTIPKTMDRLVNADIVEKHGTGKYRIVDAVFSEWILRKYKTSSL
ncbi:MAG: AAA family ATPase [Nitrosotalea sp.]